MILTDDQGYWALGAAGNTEIQTPNLDRLAETGLRCEHFFCASPVCSPARASLLTGAIPSRHGIHDWLREGNLDERASAAIGWQAERAIDYLAGQRTYSDILAENGYTCALSGKWHLGDSARQQKGFSHWFTIPGGGSDYYDPWLIRAGQLERGTGYLTDLITDDAVAFLESQSESQRESWSESRRPFYLSVHYTAPHSPWERGQHPEKLTTLYQDCPFVSCPQEPVNPWQINSAPRGTGDRRRELLQGYYAAITAVDRGVGRILAQLEALGERENTLVFFTGDNGMNMGHHGIWGKGNGTFPQNMHDTSVKVPAIFSRPGHVPAGVVSRYLLSQYDVLPTLLDYLGLPGESDERLPGRSFAPLLRWDELAERANVVVFDEYGPVRMIRSQRWKYVHRYPYGPHEFYDLANDPDERHNLIDQAASGPVVVEMKAQLDEWFARYADPARDGVREPVTGKGQIDLAGTGGQGRTAYATDWYYIDADGRRRE